MIIVEDEAKVVREIFQKYLSGLSTQKIAGELYRRKLLTRSGGPFASSLVRKILRNKIYIGKLVWNAYHYDKRQGTLKGFRYIKNDPSKVIEAQGRHQAIVEEEDFNQVQALLSRNRNGVFYRKRGREYPLSGVIKCGVCGFPFHGVCNLKNHRTGELRPYYRCSGRARHDIKCGNGDVRSELLESEVFRMLDVIFSAEGVSAERFRNLVADQYRNRATDEVSCELRKFQQDLQTCLLKQDKLTDAYLQATISREIFERKNGQLRNEEGESRIKIERMELQLIKKEQSEEYIKRAQEVVKSTRHIKENLHPALRKELLNLVFRKLLVRDQRIFEFELYEPFNAMYQSALATKSLKSSEERRDKNWNSKEKQLIPETKSQSCISLPSDVHWSCAYNDLCGILKVLYL